MDAATPIPPADSATEKVPMDALVIQGGRRLSGRVTISGLARSHHPFIRIGVIANNLVGPDQLVVRLENLARRGQDDP